MLLVACKGRDMESVARMQECGRCSRPCGRALRDGGGGMGPDWAPLAGPYHSQAHIPTYFHAKGVYSKSEWAGAPSSPTS